MELLIVMAILGILMATTLIAINPLRQIALAKNAKRKSDSIALLNAAQQYVTDHNGDLPVVVPSTPTEISKNGADLCSGFAPVYVAGLPIDPKLGSGIVKTADCGSDYDTGYTISRDPSTHQITISAPFAEYDEVISYTR